MAIFHSYVTLPEGNLHSQSYAQFHATLWPGKETGVRLYVQETVENGHQASPWHGVFLVTTSFMASWPEP